MERDKFISAIGYDGDSAIIDKIRFSKNKGKSLSELIKEGAFRSAAAYAVYTGSDSDMHAVVEAYNSLSNSNYKKEQLQRLFGVSKAEVKKAVLL